MAGFQAAKSYVSLPTFHYFCTERSARMTLMPNTLGFERIFHIYSLWCFSIQSSEKPMMASGEHTCTLKPVPPQV